MKLATHDPYEMNVIFFRPTKPSGSRFKKKVYDLNYFHIVQDI